MKHLAWILPLLVVHTLHAQVKEEFTFYKVQKKDHLAKILRGLGYNDNLFGANGWVSRVVDMNPWLKDAGIHTIPQGAYLRVPKNRGEQLKTHQTHPRKIIIEKKGVTQPARPTLGKTRPHITLFEAPADRNYVLALLETDGKNEFHKAKIPLNLKVKPGTDKTLYVLDRVNYEDLSAQAAEPIPHFKSEYFAERKVKKYKGIDGQEVKKVEYTPWSFSDRFFVHLKSGFKFVSIKSNDSSFGPFNFGLGPGISGSARLGVGLTSRMSLFIDTGGTYQTFGQISNTVTFVGTNLPLYHGGIGGWIDLDDLTRIEGSLVYQRDFFTSGDGTNILITPVMRPMFNLLSSIRFYERRANQMYVEGGVRLGLPQATGSEDLKFGFGFVTSMRYRIRLNEVNNFDMIGSFESRSQNTTFSSDTFNTIHLALGYTWK